MVSKRSVVYGPRASWRQRNQEDQVFASQETRNRLQNVLEQRRQAVVTEANNATSTPATTPVTEASTGTSTPTTTPDSAPTTSTVVPDTKEPKKSKKQETKKPKQN